MAQNVEVGLTSNAVKTLRQRNKWRQRFDHGTLMASPKFQTRMLHFKPFGTRLLAGNSWKLRFLQTVIIKVVTSLLFSPFIFTKKSL